MTILVTGGCGFIGSNFIRRWLLTNSEEVVALDAMTYAGNPETLVDLRGNKQFKFFGGSVADPILVRTILRSTKPRAIIHFAAETHVDNSITNPMPFVESNVYGTVNLLQCVLEVDPTIKFLHVSTDEVYGSLGLHDRPFDEKSPYDPRSPYSASKAASDHFVNAYSVTYGLKTIITNCSNNYGPYQHPEKFIPTVIRKALNNEQIPVYGKGENVRDWIFVYDHCDALIEVLERGRIGHKYCIGGNKELDNLTLAKTILDRLEKPHDLISYVEDRKGHDFRYSINNRKVYIDVGWRPETQFSIGLNYTINWYIQNVGWVTSCLERSESY